MKARNLGSYLSTSGKCDTGEEYEYMLGVFATLVTSISGSSEVVPAIQEVCSNWLPYLRSLSQAELDALVDERAIYKEDPKWPGKKLFCGYRESTDEELVERDRKVKAWMEKERMH